MSATLAALLLVLLIIGWAFGFVGFGKPDAPQKPGFYCNGTTAVYYNDRTILVEPWATECGGDSTP